MKTNSPSQSDFRGLENSIFYKVIGLFERNLRKSSTLFFQALPDFI